MNANTILAFRSGSGRNQMPDQTGDFTTATAALINTASGTTTAVLSVPLQTPILGSFTPSSPNANSAVLGSHYGRQFRPRGSNAPYFNSDAFEGIPFRVRVSGTVATATVALQTLLIELSCQSTGTYAAGTVIASIGAPFACAVTGGVYFSIVAECLWSIGSGSNGNLASRHSATIAKLPTPVLQVVSDVIQTNVTLPIATASLLNFVVFTTAAQTNTCTVHYNEFALELI